LQHNPEEIAARFEAVFGYGWRADFATALGIRGATVTEQFTMNRVQPWLVALLEMFEATPVAKWPPRWAALAARARAKAKKDAKAA
jgi:hypothetical protein